MPRRPRTAGIAASVALAVALLAGLLVAPAASAEPAELLFTDEIDDYARYDGADTCSPTDKPGATALRTLVLDAYPGTTGHISRSCVGGVDSEHYEGRAFDWMVSASSQRDIAYEFLDWLLADDAYGNEHAMARRLGVMYIIFDHKMWRAYQPEAGWQPYEGSNPHTDHIHISMSWDGALKDTTWFTGNDLGLRLDPLRHAATWRDPARLDVFRLGRDGELQQRTWQQPGWDTWHDLGGDLASSPAATWWRKQLWVFALGAEGTLVQRRWSPTSGWDPWTDTGMRITAAPGVTAYEQRLDVVVRTTTGSVAIRTLKGSTWTRWKDLGGQISAPPAVVRTADQRVDVFVRGTTGHLHQRSKGARGWGDWADRGGLLTSGPSATTFGRRELNVAVRTVRGTVSHRYDAGEGWSAWFELGGRHVSGPAAASVPKRRIDLLTRGRAGQLSQNVYTPDTGWSGWVAR